MAAAITASTLSNGNRNLQDKIMLLDSLAGLHLSARSLLLKKADSLPTGI